MAKPAPLTGLKIISMAEQYPGPFCTMTLADMGADVLQVERPKGGDPARVFKPFHAAINRNKRAVALDVKLADDRDRLLTLIEDADVFMEGFRPGKLGSLGLGWDDMQAINPRLIYCSVSGFGQTGPYRDWPAHDLTYQGVGGALDERLKGDVSGLPPAMLMGDTLSALYAAIAILAAVQGRALTGEGTYIDISMTDTVAAAQAAFIPMAEEGGFAAPQAEPAFDLFQCADEKWLTLSIAHEDHYWRKLCLSLDMADVADLNRTERTSRRKELKERLGVVITTKPRAHWAALFEQTDQMWGPVHRLEDVPHDPVFQARNLFERMVRGDGVEQWATRQPIKFSAFDNRPITPAPAIGEHNEELFEG